MAPQREDRRPYAFVEFSEVKSALAAMEEMEFRVRVWRSGVGLAFCLIVWVGQAYPHVILHPSISTLYKTAL